MKQINNIPYKKYKGSNGKIIKNQLGFGQEELSEFFLMTIFSETFFTLMSRHFMSFSFFSARHDPTKLRC